MEKKESYQTEMATIDNFNKMTVFHSMLEWLHLMIATNQNMIIGKLRNSNQVSNYCNIYFLDRLILAKANFVK